MNAGDITGTGFTHLMRMRLPTGPNTAQNFNFQGIPTSVNGATPVPPANGLLNVTLQCLNSMGNFPSFPHTETITFGSFWSQASLGTHLIRAAVCQTPGCLTWTYLPAPGDAVTE